ncbi:MAG: rod shape-determining protein [Chloroflexota bacterium]|nr:rod shape-determining protein [Chloroflexota bacterium]MDE2919085.1 rod shape-determining protein [Chloroflexota bacterium]
MPFGFNAPRLGIDLGTVNVVVNRIGQGITINEPSVVAVSMDRRIQAIGHAAHAMVGRTPGSLRIIRPMQDGVIADYLVTEAMLRYFIERSCGRFRLVRPEIMVAVPSGVTTVERRAVLDAGLAAGARRVHLIPESLAAAIGAQVPVSEPSGSMIVNVGGGTTEISVISLNDVVADCSTSSRVGGNRIDDAIAAYIRRKYNLMVGDHTAEQIKIGIGSAIVLSPAETMEVRGRDQVQGLPRTVTVTSDEVTEAITEPLSQIVRGVRMVLESTPPELSADIIDKGIVMSGGTSLLRNLDQLLSQEIGIAVHVADQPLMCVALGCGIAIEHTDVLQKALTSSP